MLLCTTLFKMSHCNAVIPFASGVPHRKIVRIRLEDAPFEREVLDLDLDYMLIQRCMN